MVVVSVFLVLGYGSFGGAGILGGEMRSVLKEGDVVRRYVRVNAEGGR